jgi:hypothetical protein
MLSYEWNSKLITHDFLFNDDDDDDYNDDDDGSF